MLSVDVSKASVVMRYLHSSSSRPHIPSVPILYLHMFLLWLPHRQMCTCCSLHVKHRQRHNESEWVGGCSTLHCCCCFFLGFVIGRILFLTSCERSVDSIRSVRPLKSKFRAITRGDVIHWVSTPIFLNFSFCIPEYIVFFRGICGRNSGLGFCIIYDCK